MYCLFSVYPIIFYCLFQRLAKLSKISSETIRVKGTSPSLSCVFHENVIYLFFKHTLKQKNLQGEC